MPGDLNKLLYEGNILNRVDKLEVDAKKLRSGTLRVVTLENITNDMGLQLSGEFRAGNEIEPGSGFSGVRMGSPAFSYGSGTWNLVGVNNDVLEFGLDSVTGKAYLGGGSVVLDSTGEKFYNGPLLTLWLQPDGDIFAGSDLASPDTTTFALFTNAQTYNGEAIAAGSQMIGSNSAGFANIFYDSITGQLQFRGGAAVQAYVGTDGVIHAGGGNVYLAADGFHIANNLSGLIFDGVSLGYSTKIYQTNTNFIVIKSDFAGGNLLIWNTSFPAYQLISGYSNSDSFKVCGSMNYLQSACLVLYGKDNGDHTSAVQFIGTDSSNGSDRGYFRIYSRKDTKDVLRCYTSPTTTEWANSGIELLGAGPIINEFSTDGTMAGNSDTALPTEKAVVTYVAAHGGGGGGGCPARAIMGV